MTVHLDTYDLVIAVASGTMVAAEASEHLARRTGPLN